MRAIRLTLAFIVATFATVTLTATAARAQGGYPDRAVRIIVGFTAGSSTDITARIFALKFSEFWHVPVTVENVPGVGGSAGVDRVAKAAPDGYTLVWGANGALTINPTLLPKLAYDPTRDLAPVSILLMMPSILATNVDVPVKTLGEFIALAKREPGKLSYATPGVGTPQHIAGELLKSLAGIDVIHIPYRGAQFTDVIGGRVTMAFQNAGAMLPTVREGKLRGLATTSLTRSPNISELPTVAESGFPGFEAISWFGLMAPAGTPPDIIKKIHADAQKVVADPGMREKFAQLGLDTVGSTPDEMGSAIKRDIAKWAKVIQDASIKAPE